MADTATADSSASTSEPNEQPAGAAQNSETFDQTMVRLGGYSPPAVASEKTDAPKTAPAPKAAKGKRGAPTPPRSSEEVAAPVPANSDAMGRLEALAKELGLEVETGKVTAAERVRFRERKRIQEARLAEQAQASAAKIQQMRQRWEETVGRTAEVKAAFESLDPERIASATGFRSFHEFQIAIHKKLTDPNYLRIRELEEREAERERQQQSAQHQQRAALARQSEAQRTNSYLSELAATMRQSTNPVVSALADDPRFVRTVFQIQKENYDPETKTTLPPEKAIKLGVRGAARALEDELRMMHGHLGKAFGGQVAASQAASKPAAPPRARQEWRPAPEGGRRMSKVDYEKYFAARLSEAIREDRKAEYAEKVRRGA